MAYNYTVEYLETNRDAVAMVHESFKTRQVFRSTFTHAKDCVREQFRMNNILRSLAVNWPDEYAKYREMLATWTAKEPSGWILYFGPRRHNSVGRRPGATATSNWQTTGLTDLATPAEEYQHDIAIDDVPSMERFVGRVLELPPETTRVIAEFVHEVVNLEYFCTVFEGWTPSLNGPNTLVLERQ